MELVSTIASAVYDFTSNKAVLSRSDWLGGFRGLAGTSTIASVLYSMTAMGSVGESRHLRPSLCIRFSYVGMGSTA